MFNPNDRQSLIAALLMGQQPQSQGGLLGPAFQPQEVQGILQQIAAAGSTAKPGGGASWQVIDGQLVPSQGIGQGRYTSPFSDPPPRLEINPELEYLKNIGKK